MTLVSLLALGFLMGVRHALEADHLAAVASLATRARSPRESVALAALWGCGHAAVLVALGGLLAALNLALPSRLERAFEALAGLVLVALGVDVIRRLRRRRVHFHLHQHGDGVRHLHAHAHEGEPAAAHDPDRHQHAHPALFMSRAVLVGSLHGLAGSGALVVMAVQAAGSPAMALAYTVVFGAGSVLGMVVFSVAVVLPLKLHGDRLSLAMQALEGAVGLGSVAVGGWMAVRAVLGR
jgi:ABC-type nickel/cobalt efflux system permease component RcnA